MSFSKRPTHATRPVRHARFAEPASASSSHSSRTKAFQGPRPRNFNARKITGALSLKTSEGIVRPASLMGVKWQFLAVTKGGKNDLAASWDPSSGAEQGYKFQLPSTKQPVPPIGHEYSALSGMDAEGDPDSARSGNTTASAASADLHTMQVTSWADQKAARIHKLRGELQKLEEETLSKFHEDVDNDQLEAIRRDQEEAAGGGPADPSAFRRRAPPAPLQIDSAGDESSFAVSSVDGDGDRTRASHDSDTDGPGGPIDVTEDNELQNLLAGPAATGDLEEEEGDAGSASGGGEKDRGSPQQSGAGNVTATTSSSEQPAVDANSKSPGDQGGDEHGSVADANAAANGTGSPSQIRATGSMSSLPRGGGSPRSVLAAKDSSASLDGIAPTNASPSTLRRRAGQKEGGKSSPHSIASSSHRSLPGLSNPASPRVGQAGQFPDRFKPLRRRGPAPPQEIPLSDLEKEISKVEEEAAAIERELAQSDEVSSDQKGPQTMEVDPSLLIWRSTASVREIDSLPEDAEDMPKGGGKSLQAMTVTEKKKKKQAKKKGKSKLEILQDSLKSYETSFGKESAFGKMPPRVKYGAWYMPTTRWGMPDEPIQPVKTIAKLTDPEEDHPLNREQQNLFATKLYKDYIKRTADRMPRYLEDVEDLQAPEEEEKTARDRMRINIGRTDSQRPLNQMNSSRRLKAQNSSALSFGSAAG